MAADTFTRTKFAWLDQVMADASIPPSGFSLAYLIASYLNRGTGDAWPSQPTLAARMRMTPRAIRNLTEQLEAAGHLSITEARGRGHSCRYRPIVHQPSPSIDPHDTVAEQDDLFPRPETKTSPDVGFDEFWLQYPRKVSKEAARKAYERARREASADVLLTSAMRYSAVRTGQDPKYTKHPATWLNGKCWLDETEPAQAYSRDDVSGRATVDAIGAFHVDFGLTNPNTITYLRNYEMGLIRALSSDALASVRTAIQAGVAAGRNPLDVARDVRQFIGLTDTQTRAVLNYRSALENGSRDALARALRDRRFDASVARAVRGELDLAPEKIDTLVARYSERYLRYRSETIARTEGMRAVNAGNHLLWNQAVADGKLEASQITRKWLTVGDHKVRASHRVIPDMNPEGVGLNVPFASPEGPILFPGDPNAPADMTVNCRCTCLYRFKLRSTQGG